MPDLTISDLKRALVEVKRMCAKRPYCTKPIRCPLYHDETDTCSLGHSYPEYWDTEEWEEDSDALAYIQQLEACRWELFDYLSTAYYGKQMYGLNDDGTVYSRYSCDTMPFERAVDEFRRLIADE